MILSVNSVANSYNITNLKNEKLSVLKNFNNSFEFPSYEFYNPIAFCGIGMNLCATKNRLDELGINYPDGIREEMNRTLELGNPENKTLLDIHRDHYCVLEDCSSIKELRDSKLYPEFDNVKSDSEVPIKKGTFIERVKNGEIEGFDKDTDVSLQLLRLYWGQGFSLDTLKKHFPGTNYTKLFDKLNIPRVDSTYGIYLKRSDKDFNDYMTQRIEKNRLARLKEQKNSEVESHKTVSGKELQNDEQITAQNTECPGKFYDKEREQNLGVVLKSEQSCSSEGPAQSSDTGLDESKTRKPLSEEHKNSISEALIEHYKNFPMSDEHKNSIAAGVIKFFEEHPERREEMSEIFSQVLLRAWNYEEGLEIRRKMANFMKKNSFDKEYTDKIRQKTISNEDIDLEKLSDKNNLEKFWKSNPDSRKLFSKCMLKSWKRQKELAKMGLIYEPLYECSYIPKGLQKQTAGLNCKIIITDSRDNERDNYTQPGALVCGYGQINNEITKIVEICTFVTLNDLLLNIQKQDLKKEYKNLILNFIPDNNLINYTALIRCSISIGDKDFAEKLNENLDNHYEKMKNMTEQERKNYVYGRVASLVVMAQSIVEKHSGNNIPLNQVRNYAKELTKNEKNR